ncbi:MAG: S-methyl-5-thioribose-1-phosphate isomerase [Bacillota bacterium]|jgi:methylthioribose-1-phosphate isomerase|nr:S-methyl-5-thioribose-1-phosphate isomerase [Bacillota bacterium]HHU29131.1 S-methyl-5-thioribose-1-phosphate isomerase [Bacillota bacterium]
METIRIGDKKVAFLDQRKLPEETVYLECGSWQEVAAAIKQMVVRGAPAIGAAAAFGMALAAFQYSWQEKKDFRANLEKAAKGLLAARPTAVNLAWAVEKMADSAQKAAGKEPAAVAELLWQEAVQIADRDVAINKSLGDVGAELIPGEADILTHCNAGALATVGYGTALGVVRSAAAQGKKVSVYAGETRPYLQGARLTAWELRQDNIPVTLIADNMAGYLMQQNKIDLVLVGADRIAANGDTANKIGTYSLAVLAKAHGIPFYVAAPLSTFDLSIKNGSQIVIEERPAEELTQLAGKAIAPEGIKCYNPSFDVTPAHLITAIITEKGIIKKPSEESIGRFF